MAIEKEYGKYIPVCDGCLTTLEPCDTFQDAVDQCKEEGWTNHRIDGQWQNRCPNCRPKSQPKPVVPRLDW